MLNWLFDTYELVGDSGRNWVLVFGAGILIYAVTLVITQRGQRIV